jgi:deoxyribose-phosphate aldolase
LGATTTAAKVAETEGALHGGAREIDMVLNIGALLGGDRDAARQDIRRVVEVSHRSGAIVKVILETALLDEARKIEAAVLAKEAGADFVKTSTGFGPGGATAHDVSLLWAAVGPGMGVKASGGIRTLDDVNAMIAAGASRIGTSAGVAIMEAATGNATLPASPAAY